jgi:putative membrane protein
MILKRNFNPLAVLHYVQTEMLVCSLAAVLAFSLQAMGKVPFVLPFSITAILGSALAIFIAFRNNNAYNRWWEARNLWGNILNSSRVLGRLVITFAESHSHQPNFDAQRSRAFQVQMLRSIAAWAHALRLQLRNQSEPETLKRWLDAERYQQIQQAENKPNTLLLLMGRQIYQAMADGTLGGFDSFQMEGQLLNLSNLQGGCERIKNTPMLRQYDFFTRLFYYAFVVLLPFSLLPDLERMGQTAILIPLSLIIGFVFAILAKVGEVNEDPFENRITDVPLSAICRTIERDLLEMLGETELPGRLQPEKGFLW